MYQVPNELTELFSRLFDDKQKIRYVAESANLPLGMIDFNGPPMLVWHTVLKESRKHEMTGDLLDAAARQYPAVNWKNIRQMLDGTANIHSIKAPKIGGSDWHGKKSRVELEKITGKEPTFLPLHFLELGQMRARSVALITVEGGAGTGFLIKNDLILTNNHVIASKEEAAKAAVVFNFQNNLDGSASTPTTFSLKPELGFATSELHDWTAVRVDGNANSAWGEIPLIDCKVAEGDYVNIIQHPLGNPKVIALYHNVVVFSDNDRMQYLTDTLPGSSGSPVFRSDWTLAAIHHAGGDFMNDGSVRNQGISVHRLINDLTSARLI